MWLLLDPRVFASADFLRAIGRGLVGTEARSDRVQRIPPIVAPGKVSLRAIAMCLRQLGGSPRFLLRLHSPAPVSDCFWDLFVFFPVWRFYVFVWFVSGVAYCI